MTHPKGQRVLVAGGAGFIGSHLCRALLDAGHEVTCLDNMQTARPRNLVDLRTRRGFRFVQHDITEPLPAAVRQPAAPFTRIYNLACAASPPQYQADPEHTMMTNVVGTRNLLRLAESHGARFLLTSTSEVYGDPEIHPQTEDYRGNVNCTGPRSCYDEGKRAAETLAFDFARLARAEVRVARIFNTYGPQMHPEDGRVISNFLCQMITGSEVTVYGDGEQTRSFCYVTDMVDGLVRLMEADGQSVGPVNLGNPAEITINELLDAAAEIAGERARTVHMPLPQDDPQRRRPDIAQARQRLGWKPHVGLREGLAKTYAYFAEEVGSQLSQPAAAEKPRSQPAAMPALT